MYLVFIILIFSFLLGSIPTAYFIVMKATGKDLRKVGSGNIGGSNARRASEDLGQARLIYWTVAAIDTLKGMLPVLTMLSIVSVYKIENERELLLVAAAVLAILGHDTMIFLKGGRGKGVGTTIGGLLPIAPLPVITGIILFLIMHLFIKNNNAGLKSLITGIGMVLTCLITNNSAVIKLAFVFAILLMMFTHRENIKKIVYK